MQQLTDEERKKLCEWLRFTDEEHWWADNCGIAADEIERLAEDAHKARCETEYWKGRCTMAVIGASGTEQ
jgi:hypothetical protein